MDVARLIDESVEDVSFEEREAFECLFRGVSPTTLEKWLDLQNYDFYRVVTERLRRYKFFSSDVNSDAIADKVESYVNLHGKDLEKYIETEDGKALLDEVAYMSAAKLAIAHILGIVRFVGETCVLVGSFTVRALGKLAAEEAIALKNTFSFIKADSKRLVSEVGQSLEHNRYKTVRKTIRDRA